LHLFHLQSDTFHRRLLFASSYSFPCDNTRCVISSSIICCLPFTSFHDLTTFIVRRCRSTTLCSFHTHTQYRLPWKKHL
jgi:hypothetical protein